MAFRMTETGNFQTIFLYAKIYPGKTEWPSEGEKAVNDMLCIGCQKTPAQLDEYVMAGAVEDMSPEEFVRQEEGTLNPVNGHFLCTNCYINSRADRLAKQIDAAWFMAEHLFDLESRAEWEKRYPGQALEMIIHAISGKRRVHP